MSTVAAYLAAEAAFALVGLRYLPLRLHGELPEEIRVFTLSSKAGVLPRNLVLLLGDSYAQGYGDWLLETNPNGNGPFHSGHIIQALTGRDVVTLGVSGAGSAEGIAAVPAVAYAHADHAWYLRLPKPGVAVVYFYEGNDLNNNLTFLEHRVANPDAADLVERIDRSIAGYPSQLFADPGWSRHFPLWRFVVRMVQQAYREATGAAPAPEDPSVAAQADSPNAVEIAGRSAELPGHLQSPALELTRADLERATLVFDRSLVALQQLLPGTPVLVVYVPSPLELSAVGRGGVEPAICAGRRHALSEGARVGVQQRRMRADPDRNDRPWRRVPRFTPGHPGRQRPRLRDGPRDFKHFNRAGMEALGRAVAARIDRPLLDEPCSQGPN